MGLLSRKRGWTGRLFLVILVVACGWTQYVLWFGSQGLVRWRQIEEKLQRATARNHELTQRIERLKREILLVEKEPLVLEEVARRDLGLVYPDEIIFVLSKDGKRAEKVEKGE